MEACPHRGEIYTPVFIISIYLSITYLSISLSVCLSVCLSLCLSIYLYFMSLLTCTDRTVDRTNIINGSIYVPSRKVGIFWG